MPVLNAEGVYPSLGGTGETYRLDNWTDSVMLSTAYSMDSAQPLTSALRGTHYRSDRISSLVGSLNEQVSLQSPGNRDYARYWHGYLVFLRPLLTVMALPQIRLLYQGVFFALTALIVALLARRVSLAVALVFGVGLATVNASVVPFSLQFSTDFFIAFAASLYVLLRGDLPYRRLMTFLFVTGAVTAYLDLLVAPLLTLGMPLVIVLLINREKTEQNGYLRAIASLTGICLAWAAGYALLWASKWLLAGAILGRDVLSAALDVVAFRTTGDVRWIQDGQPVYVHALWLNLLAYFHDNSTLMKVVAAAVVLTLVAGALLVKAGKLRGVALAQLVLAALLPYAWFVAASNHSAYHYWFTYRIQFVTFFALAAAICLAAGDLPKPRAFAHTRD